MPSNYSEEILTEERPQSGPAYPYKKRFLIKSGKKLQFRHACDVAYFFADGKEVYLVPRKENRKYLIDHTLETLGTLLDPDLFFRISRKFIVNIDAIAEIKGTISTRLQIKLNQSCEHDLYVSRDRSMAFKSWLDL